MSTAKTNRKTSSWIAEGSLSVDHVQLSVQLFWVNCGSYGLFILVLWRAQSWQQAPNLVTQTSAAALHRFAQPSMRHIHWSHVFNGGYSPKAYLLERTPTLPCISAGVHTWKCKTEYLQISKPVRFKAKEFASTPTTTDPLDNSEQMATGIFDSSPFPGLAKYPRHESY